MDFMQQVEQKGISGGLCAFWKDEGNISSIVWSSFYIELGVSSDPIHSDWKMIDAYASTDNKRKRGQWSELNVRISSSQGKCIVIGD